MADQTGKESRRPSERLTEEERYEFERQLELMYIDLFEYASELMGKAALIREHVKKLIG
jgi:hypothetical protein